MRVQSPVWSPDGTESRTWRGRSRFRFSAPFLVMDAAGGDPDTLLTGPAHFSGLSRSPDGSSIVFSSYLARTCHLWSVAPTGGEPVLPLLGTPHSSYA